jgi:very-short-patch-repair endonuclease
MKVEEFLKLKKGKRKMSFDGVAIIRSRLTMLNVVFTEEVEFARPRRYRADFVIMGEDGPVVLEYEGATFVKGGHSSSLGISRDCEKSNLAQALGFKYIRFTQDMLKRDLYFEEIIQMIVDGYHPNKNWTGGKSRG